MEYNVNIASQIKGAFLNKEVEMSIRSKQKGTIKFFIKNNNCQKIFYEQFKMNASTLEDIDLVDIPSNVFRRFALLVYSAVSDIQSDLNYTTIIIEWNFDVENDFHEEVSISVSKEIHMSYM